MKLRPSLCRSDRRGMAIIVVLALLAIVLIFISANVRSLIRLRSELRLTERRQVQRLSAISATNALTIRLETPPTNAPATNRVALPPTAP